MLTSEQIKMLLKLLSQEIVVTPSTSFPFTVTQATVGYSSDPTTAQLQACLSIMLEATKRIT